MKFRETPINPGMNPKEREMHRRVQEYLARSRGQEGSTSNDPSKTGDPIGKQFGGKIIFERRGSAGSISFIKPEPPNTLMFLRGGRFRNGGNLELAESYNSIRDDQVIAMISDGIKWFEFSRSQSGSRDFVPVANFDIFPDTGADLTAQIQFALDNVESGKTLYFTPGLYLISSGLNVTRSNLSIYLDAGVIIKQTNALAVFNVTGSVTGVSTILDVGPVPGDFEITVDDNTFFTVGDWIEIADTRAPSTGTAIHRELHRIKYKSGTDILGLYYPMLDSYDSGPTSNVAKILPVENFTLEGSGALTNPSIDDDEGKVVRMVYVVRSVVRGIEIFEMGYEAIGLIACAMCLVTGTRIHDANQFWTSDAADPPSGSGGGYGITTNASHSIVIADNVIERTRHAIDISFWSQAVTACGNTITGSGSTAIQTHPDVRNAIIANNVISGVVGHQDTAFESTEYSTDVPGAGIGIRENADGVLVVCNTLINIYASGITVSGDSCRDVVISSNTIVNANLEQGATNAGIRAIGANSNNDLPGLVIANNTVKAGSVASTRYGILVGYHYATVSGNHIDGFTYGILVQSRINNRIVQDVRILDNVITNGQYGVFLGGKIASGAGGTGIGRQVHRTIVRGNRINSMTLSGIYHMNVGGSASADDYSVGGIIENNILLACNGNNTANHGGIVLLESVAVPSASFKYTVRNNYTRDNNVQGINVAGDGSVIEGNECDGEIARGIWLDPATTTAAIGITVRGNNCHHCGNEGIRIGPDAGAGNILSGTMVDSNQCWMNQGDGILNSDDAVGTYLTRNRCWNNDQGGLNLPGIRIRGDNARVFENECFDTQGGGATQQFGITVVSVASGAILRNNWVEGNVGGPYSIGATCRFTDSAGAVVDVADVAHTVALTTKHVRYTALTASRIITLPAANVVGHEIWIEDSVGTAAPGVALTPTAAGADTFDDTGVAAGPAIIIPFGSLHIRCVAAGRWKVL